MLERVNFARADRVPSITDQLSRVLKRRFALLLLIAAAVLLLTNLGNVYLWQDEAETALVSQRLGRYGLPLSFDGRNLIRQAPKDVQYTADYVWVYHPWLPFYFTALSFHFLGPTTFAARLPYALAGLFTILLLYFSLRHHFRDRRVAMLGSTFLLFCVPFLLHARQCKYFSFAALFAVAALDGYLRLREENGGDWVLPYFILSGFCLFQSNFGAFLPLMAAVGLHFLLTRPARVDIKRMVLAVGVMALFVLPWAIYLQTWARGRFVFDVYRFAGHLVHYTVYVTGWILPLPMLLLLVYWYVREWWPRNLLYVAPGEASVVNLYILVIVISIIFLSVTFIWMYFSYIVQLVPLLAALLAILVLKVMDRSRALGYALIVLLMATNVLHLVPYALPLVQRFKWASLAPRPYLAETDALIAMAGRFRLDVADYAYELTHDYDGPNEGIVLFLREHAVAGDMVLANYGELPIAFYLDLDFAGGLSGYRLESAEQAEWIINRRDGPYRDEVERIVGSGKYEAIDIPYPDLAWGNRPVPEYHKFATVYDAPNVVIYRRID
jgi:4-amino-4-deoxy-L-arabinose transferase-like glycosyltransferase